MKVKQFIYFLILSLLFSASILTNQEIREEVRSDAPLPSNQTPFPLVSATLNSSYFLQFFGDICPNCKSKDGCKTILKDMEQWAKIVVNMELFNKKIIYNLTYFNWANLRYCEFCSQNH